LCAWPPRSAAGRAASWWTPPAASGPPPRISRELARWWGLQLEDTWFSASLCHRPANGLDINQERLELRCLRIGVADRRRQRIYRRCFLGLADKAEVQRQSNRMHDLSIDRERPEPLGHDGLAFHRAAVGPNLHHVARLYAFLLRKLLRHFHE